MRGRQVIDTLEKVINGRNVSLEAKKSIRDRIILPTLTCASETWI